MKKLLVASLVLAALGAGLLNYDHKKPIVTEGEFAPKGMVAYAASYSSNITSEPKYTTQNSTTFQYLNLGNTLSIYRGDSVKVGIIDSGINYDHEDFMVSGSTKVKGNSKYYAYQSSSWVYYGASSHGYSYIDDTLGHGTNVAATVAAAVNSVGGLGLAPNVELYVYKVTNSNNGYEFGAIQNALMDAETLGLDVINMSFQSYEHAVSYGGSSMAASSGCSTILSYYLNQAYNAGITLVGAAGNYNTDEPSYPGSNANVINVGSLNETATGKAGFSNYGSTIDLVAPGYVYVADEASNTAYTNTQGTSFSAPLVTAAIALYKQKNRSATPAQIEAALYASCDEIDDSSSQYTNWAGHGSLNVARFLGVSEDAPTEIIINNPEIINEELELEIGDTFDLNWTVNGVGTFSNSVNIYALEDNGVLSVNNSGHITALSKGSDYIIIESVEDSSVYTSVYVNVTSSGSVTPTVSSVTVSPSTLSLYVDGTANLVASVLGENNPAQTVTWGSSNASVATVSSTGLVTAKATGNATITATSTVDATKNGTCTVTVSAKVSTGKYALITSTDDLKVGASYLITNGTSGTVKTMAVTSNTNNRPTTELTVSSNQLTRGNSALSVTLGGSSGAWTFKTENYEGTAGYLNATSTTNSNYLQVISTLDKYAYFSISFNNYAVITCTGKTSRNIIRCNTSGTPISCYSSGQNPVYLWKEVEPKILNSIEVKTAPTNTTYEAGDYFDPTGLVITQTFSDNSTQDVSYASDSSNFSFTPSTSTALTTSNTSVTIGYGGKITSQTITVTAAKSLSSISLSGQTTSFVEGDTFSFGGTVTAHFSDSSSSDVTSSASFSGFNMTSLGTQEITVSYSHKNITKIARYSITISQGTLSLISLSGQTTTYLKNHAFSFDGTCTAHFANGYQKTVTPTSVSSPDMTTAGNKTVTVTYTYNGITKDTSYGIVVQSNRTVIESQTTTEEVLIGSINFKNSKEEISNVNLISLSKSGYTNDESIGIRLGSGGNTGTITITSIAATDITRVEVKAQYYSSDNSKLDIAGTQKTLTSSMTTYSVDIDPAAKSVSISTIANGKRAYVELVKIYKTQTSSTQVDISNTEDCIGLESFIDTYMHMDYVQNLGYCADSEHHYYSSAKAAFNGLNTHQRSLFTTNSAYLTEWTRLSTWASKNGDILGSNNLLTKGQHNNLALVALKDNNSLVFAIIFSLVGLSSIGAIYIVRKRKEE